MASHEPRERLVIVEDEPVILDLLATIFDRDPLEVVRCATGREGLVAIEAGADVLLTDKNLPDVGGLELVRALRAADPTAEAIVLTGYASLDTALQAMELGVFDYLIKPPRDIFDVRRKVLQALDRRRMVRENRRLLDELRAKNAELERSIDELRRAQAELVQSEKLAGIGTLAAGVAHEIRSPLFGILGLAQAITDETDLAAARGYAEEIVEYSRSIRDIVTDLTSYSRSSEREFLAPVDVGAIIDDAVRLVRRSSATEHGIDVSLPEAPLFVHARAGELQQVLVNLLKNAIEASIGAGGARVGVSARRDGAVVSVEVTDDGPGVPVAVRGRIFDPFYTTKPAGSGTGLGLNIVYRLVTKYAGTIHVDDAPGGGARFVVRLPAVTDAAAGEPAPA
jgi:C4-dicarboxylate-specific signal transduction histidine kinase